MRMCVCVSVFVLFFSRTIDSVWPTVDVAQYQINTSAPPWRKVYTLERCLYWQNGKRLLYHVIFFASSGELVIQIYLFLHTYYRCLMPCTNRSKRSLRYCAVSAIMNPLLLSTWWLVIYCFLIKRRRSECEL